MKPWFAAAALFISLDASQAYGQTFSSASTGADGALDLTTMSCPDVIFGSPACYVQLPPNGVLNYTTINVPAGRILAFKRNLQNTPAYLLAQGPVTVQGAIIVSSLGGREPGPGGFWGGAWSYPPGVGLPGFGPGAGPQPNGSRDAKWIGPLSLVPAIGGSGGSGGGCDSFPHVGHDGTGGGGAIVIASSASVTVTGSISANGGSFFFNPGCGGNSAWGFGSGGSIRLIGNTVTVSGTLSAVGGCNLVGCGVGPEKGVIRLEAPSGTLAFTGSADPAAVLSPINPVVVGSTPTSLSIISVGGYPVPSHSGQRFDTVDLLLPVQLPDPINVVVAATNIPLGTSVGINFGTGNSGTVTPGTLTGSLSSSSATVQVSGLNRASLAYLFVSATFAVSAGAAQMNPPGPDQVAKVQVTAAPGARPLFSFQRADGSTIHAQQLPPDLLKYFRP
jgi:hypothetical protein